MIERLVDVALRNRLLVVVLVVGIAGAGYWALQTVPIDSFPDVTPALVQVFTASPGLSPVDMETLISYPIEISMYGLPGLERVQSTSIFGLSRVNVYFEDGTDIYFARRLVMERLSRAREEIPTGLGEPRLGPISTGLGRVLLYTLESEEGHDHSLMELRTAQDWIVKPMLQTVPGITEVLSLGGFVRQYQVQVDLEALLARDLTMTDVERALRANNRNVGASFLERAGEEYIVRGYGWITPGEAGLDDIRHVIVAEHGGVPTFVEDVATVAYGPEIRRGALVANGEEAVGGFVLKLIHSNTQELLARVTGRVAAIDDALPEGMTLVPYYSQGELVEEAVGTVRNALLQGAVLVLVVLYVFLGNVRSTLVVVSALPMAVLVAFLGMSLTGLSANLMSLGGLAIAIGILGDGAVVVVENVFRYLEKGDRESRSMRALVSEATREVARPIAFATAIIVIVFLPLFTLHGVEGKMFSPMAYTIAFALAGSLLMALTAIPVMCSTLIPSGVGDREPRLVAWLRAGYGHVLDRTMGRPGWVVGVASALLVASLVAFPFLGTEFVPSLREGNFMIRSVLPPGANLPTAIDYARRIQSALADFDEVTGTYSRVGRPELGGEPNPVNIVATVVNLEPLEEWDAGRSYEELQTAMGERLEEAVPGLANNISQPIQLRSDELLSGVQAQVIVSLFGGDLDRLAELGGRIEEIARGIDGAVDVRMQQQDGKPQVLVRPDRKELARLGVSIDEFLQTLETGIGGTTAGQVFEGIRRFDVFVRLEERSRARVEQVRQLPLRTTSGALVPLSRVADVEVFVGPKMISRNRASRRVFIQLNVRGRDMGSVVRDLRERVDRELDLPAGYFVDYGGQFENQERAMQRLYVVVPLAMALIFLMLFSAFRSVRYALLIFFNVPFAVIGGIFALLVSGLYLSVPAAVGFIAIFGVAVQNGVVLVDYINRLRDRGLELREAVRRGAEHRLRPVLMTALTTIFGLVPLLLADDIGSNVQRPLAAVVVGGLVTSTLLILVVLPSIYRWFAEARVEVEIR